MRRDYILIVQCPDRRGIVAAVSSFLSQKHANIVEASQFMDEAAGQFYMRARFSLDGHLPTITELENGFCEIGECFSMRWEFHDLAIKPRVLIAVSKIPHCLTDLLGRWRAGLLPIEIPAVISNHEDMRAFVEWHNIPYYCLPVTAATKTGQEDTFARLVDDLDIDLVVLARYMQVLSSRLCARLAGKCINIHHSFLPSFKGAGPYSQAHKRGVKLIGATAHYVTMDLDEGPIIEQDVQRVTHAHTPADLVRIGRDVESVVLARALTWHVERRVVLNGDKTVVFP
ncbi:MAG: formyltetrahydrofolate deformylase [Hyphomonadaceae bacterium JAD_PAG50586_4]|nr:MAG: formyltetrahydrofolate deformylase [Hyphomonadaceae bacterium JAD_PAG50586_4]